jgi:hypothetical protein
MRSVHCLFTHCQSLPKFCHHQIVFSYQSASPMIRLQVNLKLTNDVHWNIPKDHSFKRTYLCGMDCEAMRPPITSTPYFYPTPSKRTTRQQGFLPLISQATSALKNHIPDLIHLTKCRTELESYKNKFKTVIQITLYSLLQPTDQ